MKQVDESIKFAWAYLLLHGKLTTGHWSQYGGWERATYINWEQEIAEMKELREKVVTIGVDWSKTNPPQVTEELTFIDSFSDCGSTAATLGKLVLLNGEVHWIGSDESYVASIAETARMLTTKVGTPALELAAKL